MAYCMQWFAVLLLLPFPNSPSLFLMLYILALMLRHKPCLYCTLVIIALFYSSGLLYSSDLFSIQNIYGRQWIDKAIYWITNSKFKNMEYGKIPL
ncbi:hypothetical protein H8356DRAFT_1628787 [Neocallimastix lanati (nom. inval.)]|nr:hypothetical protein H8356DRAFT_1628787 [Neocallimastix sp. JGI-2020a]